MEFRGLQLDPFQVEAIEHLKEDRSVLVSAPTGTGKTIIADWVVAEALPKGQDVIYTAPIKALSNQKYRDYTRLYGNDSVGLITGDLVINRDAQLRIMTTEILRNMLLSGDELPNLKYVIVDEIHFLDDSERGTVWEEVLIYLPSRVKIIGLSATLANIREFADWLTHVRGEEVSTVIEEVRCVPLGIYLANRDAGICDVSRYEFLHRRWTSMAKKAMAEKEQKDARDRRARGAGRRRGRGGRRLRLPGQKETRHWELVKMLGGEHQPLLYFAFSRKMCEQNAKDLSRRCPDEGFTTDEEKVTIKAAVDKFDAEFIKVMTGDQERMYIKGIAYHHAGLHVGLKALTEELYEKRLIKVLYCTSTFALGINMPARTVIFQALRKYNGHAVVPLTVRQFMQKAGRAGRRGIDDVGYVVILEEFEDYERDAEFISKYLAGDHEKVTSSFNLSFNSVVNLLERHERDMDEIRSVIDKSFLNFSYIQREQRDRGRLNDIARSLKADGWDPTDPEAGSPPRHLTARAKKYRKLGKAASKHSDRVFSGLMEKIGILQKIQYLEKDLTFNAGARVLQHLQIEEIFSSELVLEGLLDSLEPELIFGALCALSNSFGRTVTVRQRPRGEAAKLARAMRQIRFGDTVRTCEAALGQPVTFTPEMIPFGVSWYEGRQLNDLMEMIESANDISGDLVSAFRRAKDLSMQLRRVYAEDPFMGDKLREIAKMVSRDEVEVVD
ncbi:MAG: DEAD/DEAH box helicase [Proteobacteria bacterium]|nr:DEAD/DEAH box helicase [Pseudomonadota bacterium]